MRQARSKTGEEREAECGKHVFNICALDGRYEAEMGSENVFDFLTQSLRFIVDTNFCAKREFAKPQHKSKSFIFTETILDENSHIPGLLFGDDVIFANGNVFVLHPMRFSNGRGFILHKLDRFFESWIEDKSDEYQTMLNEDNKQTRQRVLTLLESDNISHFAPNEQLAEKRSRLLQIVQAAAADCSGDYEKAENVALHCYALLLCEDGKIRRELAEFERGDNPNAFGDFRLIRAALFSQGEILSQDRRLGAMATYVGLNRWSAIPNIL